MAKMIDVEAPADETPKERRARKLAGIRSRVKDVFRHSGEDVDKNEVRKCGMGVFAEMKFLLDEIDILSGKAAPVEELAVA